MKYEKIGQQVGKVVDTKQVLYGDSYGKSEAILKALYPDGIKPCQYKDLLYIVRVNDKLSRIATNNDKDGENPAQDIAGYSLLKMAVKTTNLFEKHKKRSLPQNDTNVVEQLNNIVKPPEDEIA